MLLEFELFQGIIINTSILLLVANILTKISFVRKFIFEKRGSYKSKLILIIFFGLTAVISTYSGTHVNGAIVNIRVVSVLGSGLLFGPFVGIGTGIIAGIHRFFVDTADFTNLACAISTILEGLLGGVFYLRFRKSEYYEYHKVFLVGIIAGCLQMIMILLVAKPFEEALALVSIIALPMILINSLGVVLFVSIFDSVFIWQERQSAKKIKLVLNIAEQCLPHLRKGLYNRDELNKAARIIYEKSSATHVVICDLNEILVSIGDYSPEKDQFMSFLEFSRLEIESKNYIDPQIIRSSLNEKYQVLIAPLTSSDTVSGFLMLVTPTNYSRNELMVEFVEGLSKLMSTQLELSQIDIQKDVVKKAEFDALQSQINPHFIFNVLTTIISISRYDSDKARELLVSMSLYFRSVLKSGYDLITLEDEMKHVEAYLTLEKARFDEKLVVIVNYEVQESWLVPRFMIQPLVENSIKHGIQKKCNRRGQVIVDVIQKNDLIEISVKDDGVGMEQSTIEALYNNSLPCDKVGLNNVHQRLMYFYGTGLEIESVLGRGTEVKIRIYERSEKNVKGCNC